MSKYEVRYGPNKEFLLGKHSTLEAAGKHMNEFNSVPRPLGGWASVVHRADPGVRGAGDVSGLAMMLTSAPYSPAMVRRDRPKKPRRLERRKHGKGDQVDEILRRLRRESRR